MNFARVSGTVVAERRAESIPNARYLLVEECDQKGQGRGEYLVAFDIIGANRGEMVLLTQGSSCRWVREAEDRPIDTLVIATVDTIDQSGTIMYAAGERK